MKDSSLIISLLIGLIVVLVIGGVSLLVKMNSLSGSYKQQLAKNINSERDVESLKEDNLKLKKDFKELNEQLDNFKIESVSKIGNLTKENIKLEELKIKLEENLKEELMNKRLSEQETKLEENSEEESINKKLSEQE
ncbi:MAG: hypothetical protein ABIH08_01255 [Candidatus Omnitrophota bacterium]